MSLLRVRDWKISAKLMLLATIIGAGYVVVIDLIVVRDGTRALLEQESRALEAVRNSRQRFIEGYFRIIREQMRTFAHDPAIADAIERLADAYPRVPEQTGRSGAPDSPAAETLRGYYAGDFRARLEEAGLSWPGVDRFVPSSPPAVLLQAMYIAENEAPPGRKHDLDEAPGGGDYNRAHARYHPILREYLESFGYYDIFLFDVEGNLVYSVFKETDFATNFLDGPYRETDLARVLTRARDDASGQVIAIEDYAPYEPSYGAAASFIGAPVLRDGEMLGVAVFQMPVDRIDEIMGDVAGLGRSGETYLIAHDGRMRSQGRFSDEKTIFVQTVSSEAAALARQGGTGTIEQESYLGSEVLCSYAPLQIEGLDWAILAEIGMDEVVAPAIALRNRVILFSVVIAVVAGLVFLVLLRRIVVTPVRGMVDRLRDIAEGDGDLTRRIAEDRGDELGELAGWFNTFIGIVHDIVKRVTETTASVAAAAKQIAAASHEQETTVGSFGSSTHEIATAVKEISAAGTELAGTMTEISGVARSAASVAGAGRAGLDEMGMTMSELLGSTESISARLGAINEKAARITTIVNTIIKVADQTNLLSINAGIEAGKAGAKGSGFIVVAREIRSLADQTAEATLVIEQDVRELQEAVATGVHEMDAFSGTVRREVEQVAGISGQLGELIGQVQGLNESFDSVSSGMSDQSLGARRIDEAMGTLTGNAQRTMASLAEFTTAARHLEDATAQLQQEVARFRLEQG